MSAPVRRFQVHAWRQERVTGWFEGETPGEAADAAVEAWGACDVAQVFEENGEEVRSW